jgi:glutaryl-CoA dehydrogenase
MNAVAAAPASDQYGVFDALDAREQGVLLELRRFLETEMHPLLADAWERAELPAGLREGLVSRRLMDPAALGGDEPSARYAGWRSFELARVDASVASYYNAVAGLFRTTVRFGGSPQQAADWDPLIRGWRLTGAFALTEPEHGSDIARGIQTRCRRSGGDWVIDGAKRWIGGAGELDNVVVFARDDDDVRAFLVPNDAPGVRLTRIERKASLRIIQNYDIALEGVRIPDERRLGGIASFRDVADILRHLRSDAAWIATGVAAGAYEAALRYTGARVQFGRPLAAFQLVQEKLARMLANVTASLALVDTLTARQAGGVWRDEDSALAKLFTADRARETALLAREVCGGNGITLDADVARFHADVEAVYSYEGTHDVNSLIVALAATGVGAFV